MADMKPPISNKFRACAGVVLALSALTAWGCASASTPAAPQTYAVSGTVFKTASGAKAPVGSIFVIDEHSHLNATSDAKGFYRIEGFTAGKNVALSASGSPYYVAHPSAFVISDNTIEDIEMREVVE
jgi:hypothetical protein